MRRLLAVTLTYSLLLAGCGSTSTPKSTPTAPAPAPRVDAPATTTPLEVGIQNAVSGAVWGESFKKVEPTGPKSNTLTVEATPTFEQLTPEQQREMLFLLVGRYQETRTLALRNRNLLDADADKAIMVHVTAPGGRFTLTGSASGELVLADPNGTEYRQAPKVPVPLFIPTPKVDSLRVGMAAAELQTLLGDPETQSKTTSSYGTVEYLHYRPGFDTNYKLLVIRLEDGVVSSWSERK